MSKSRFVLDSFAKLIEKGLVNYKDISEEVINILKSKKEEIIRFMQVPSNEEFQVLVKRLDKLEKKFEIANKKKLGKKTKRVKKP